MNQLDWRDTGTHYNLDCIHQSIANGFQEHLCFKKKKVAFTVATNEVSKLYHTKISSIDQMPEIKLLKPLFIYYVYFIIMSYWDNRWWSICKKNLLRVLNLALFCNYYKSKSIQVLEENCINASKLIQLYNHLKAIDKKMSVEQFHMVDF